MKIVEAIALSIIKTEKGESIRNAIKFVTDKFHLNNKEKKIVYYFTFEIFRRLNVIDLYIKDSSASFSFKELEQKTKALLRISTFILKYTKDQYQHLIKYISNMPITVRDVTGKEIKLKGMINEIKNIKERDLFTNKDEASLLAIKYFTPTWIVRKLLLQWDKQLVFDFLKSSQTSLPVYIRVNTLKSNIKKVRSILDEQDVSYKIDKDIKNLIEIIESKTSLPSLKAYNQGYFIIQQKSSALVSEVLNPKIDEKILDMCAAPGQKTSHIAALRGSGEGIMAIENNKRRAKILEQRLSLLGVKGVRVVNTDVLKLDDKTSTQFDNILIDPPCSGSGTFATRPDNKYRLSKRRLHYYQDFQMKLIEKANKLLKVNGTITYSTCSIFKEETREIIINFLKEHENFELITTKPFIGIPVGELENKAQILFPNIHRTEGFFVAKLRKAYQ